ncbi:FGGY family carbohydrate kinase [Streptomyces johnsoniae]|uniref:FGGY family carbohydrate kinase n=1 Tax=Streptomyces johnsoniae TaxID=3075532 RepID=A0ABU2S6W6_9ACTN|nr:FGGY family carbohydrate kinase [Streptomyces sp. DSM 41886]MDT0444713.1 FGGY family carbohydrate kinase [Streptomyces sp. DSM 41886]
MKSPAVLALDQGTSSTKAVLVDADGVVRATAARPLALAHPGPGRVEQDPAEIWASVVAAAGEALTALAGRPGTELAAVALSTQRESVLAWRADTGEPLGPLVSWQDRRGAARCARLAAGAEGREITARTGLPVDPMFSATKAAALLDELDPGRRAARSGRIRVGTVDAWLLRRITGRDVMEIGNASRTQLLDLATGAWDPHLLDVFGVERAALPEPVPSTGPFGSADGLPGVRPGTPLAAVLADSHAALFAHGAGRPGLVKATYGSGSSLMALAPAGTDSGPVPEGLARTVAWQLPGTGPALAFEANIAAAGTAVRWAARLLGTDERGLAALAEEAGETTAVLVPAFEGLGAPYWDRRATAVFTGFTQATTRADFARAALDSTAFQVAETLRLFERALGPQRVLHADGGASANAALMRLQADLCGCQVRVSAHPENSALGAARLAGVALGLWTDADVRRHAERDTTLARPRRDAAWRAAHLARWRDAVRRARLPSDVP